MFKNLFYSLIIVMSMGIYAQTTTTKTVEITSIEQIQFTPVKSTPIAYTVTPIEQPKSSMIDNLIVTLVTALVFIIGIACFISLYNKANEDI